MKTKNDNRQIIKPKNIFKEFGDFEIEEKFQVLGKIRTDFLGKIENVICRNKNIISVSGQEEFSWIFHFDYYGYKKDGKLKQAFVIIHHPSTSKFWIREKEESKIFQIKIKDFKAWIIKRKELQFLKKRRFLKKYSDHIVKDKTKQLGATIFLLDRLTREKYYTFLKNIKTGRTYSLSLDFCKAFGQKMSQLEIEYKWRDSSFKNNPVNIDSIIREFKLFSKILLSNSSDLKLIPTKLTKFEWLSKITNES